MGNKIPLALAAVIGVFGASALAQTAPGAPGSNQAIPEKDPSLLGAEPKDGVPMSSGRSGSLSDKLDASGGVIKPKPGVDPGIVQPAPVRTAEFDAGHSAAGDARRPARPRGEVRGRRRPTLERDEEKCKHFSARISRTNWNRSRHMRLGRVDLNAS